MKNYFSAVWKWAGGLSLGVLLLALAGGGCATQAYEKGNAAARSLSAASADVQAESRAIDSTIAALKTLVSAPAADLKPQYQAYRQALKRLEAATVRTTKTGAALSQKNEAYLAEWEKELASINYEYIRERSQKRREEVRTSFETVQRRYSEAQGAVDPLISYLRDIRVALASDLTPGGLEAIRGIASNAEDNSKKVQITLSNLDSDLQTLSQRLSSQTTPPAPAK
jgi:chromosome segregation ATPase